jgi:hypothetical protein
MDHLVILSQRQVEKTHNTTVHLGDGTHIRIQQLYNHYITRFVLT